MKWILIFVLFSLHSFADTGDYRKNSKGSFLVGYELASSWVPFKWTAAYTHIFDQKWSLEGEFGRGRFGIGALGFDAASVTEQRYSLLARRYSGNSFNWIFGLYENDFRTKLGSDIVDRMTNKSIDEFKVRVLGVSVGMGNRWQWKKGFTLGIDWVRINAPIIDRKANDTVLGRIKDGSDHDRVKKAVNKISNVPSFVLMGVTLGYTF